MILEITDGHWVGATFRLGRRTLTIGRDPRNVVQIPDDPKVSRRHALIRYDGVRHVLVDLHSRNGMTHNGKEGSQGELKVGDVLSIGDTTFEVTTGLRVVDDATFKAKASGAKAVRATASANSTLRLDVDAAIKGGELVDVDEFHAAQELLVQRIAFGVGRKLARGKAPLEVLEAVGEQIRELLEPDRLFLLHITDEQRIKLVVRQFGDGLTDDQKAARPWMEGLSAAAGRKKPYISNELPEKAAPLGTMVAVPVKGAERVVGVIYMDSFVSSSQSFTDDDAAILAELANSLRPCFDGLSPAT